LHEIDVFQTFIVEKSLPLEVLSASERHGVDFLCPRVTRSTTWLLQTSPFGNGETLHGDDNGKLSLHMVNAKRHSGAYFCTTVTGRSFHAIGVILLTGMSS
jgi:hypothetical protein